MGFNPFPTDVTNEAPLSVTDSMVENAVDIYARAFGAAVQASDNGHRNALRAVLTAARSPVTDAMVEAGARAICNARNRVAPGKCIWNVVSEVQREHCMALSRAALTAALAAQPQRGANDTRLF